VLEILYSNGFGVAPISKVPTPFILRRNNRITEVQGSISPYTFLLHRCKNRVTA